MSARSVHDDLDPLGLHGEEPALWLFEIEVGRQARIGLAAGRQLDLATSGGETDFDLIFGSLQALLAAAGNVSKLLKPARRVSHNGIAKRGETLRARLEVDERSPVLDRTLRNHFEHYDERLEDFVRGGGRGFADVLVGAEPGSRPDYPARAYLRRYDPETAEASFAGDRLEIGALRVELARLAQLVARRHPVFGEGYPPAAAPW